MQRCFSDKIKDGKWIGESPTDDVMTRVGQGLSFDATDNECNSHVIADSNGTIWTLKKWKELKDKDSILLYKPRESKLLQIPMHIPIIKQVMLSSSLNH